MDARTLLLARDQWTRHATDALVLVLPAASEHWDLPEVLRTRIDEAVADGDFEPKVGKAFAWYRPADLAAHRLWVVIAATDEVGVPTAQGVGKAMTVVAEGLKSSGAKQVDLVWGGQGEWTAEAVQSAVTSWLSAQYVYRLTKPSAPASTGPQKLRVAASRENAAALKAGLKRAVAIAAGVELARECANRPGNHGTPTVLAREAQALGKAHGVDVEVLDRKTVEKLGMGAFLSVAKGSDEPLQFIVLRYMGAAKKDAPIVLVGKGITFDTGGISIKPSAEMDEMKFDMGGAASVLGTFRAVAELKPKVNLIGLIPACENMPSGRATKPGDVVTSMSGKTIEVLNTDAEGRLILCDALTYAERFKPAVVIDIATLTGACVIALGAHRSGLFSPDDALAAELLAAGEAAQDPAWRMPLDDAYDDALKSNFADMGNVGPRAGGAITAAMFLKRFTGAYRWAHLDIAGTAWKSGAAKGGTGRPVPLLTQFVLSCAA